VSSVARSMLSSRKYPYSVLVVPGFPVGEWNPEMLYHEAGTRPRASPFATRNSRNCSGVCKPPGRRHAIPQIAIGLTTVAVEELGPLVGLPFN
jgi:hypothetical protein